MRPRAHPEQHACPRTACPLRAAWRGCSRGERRRCGLCGEGSNRLLAGLNPRHWFKKRTWTAVHVLHAHYVLRLAGARVFETVSVVATASEIDALLGKGWMTEHDIGVEVDHAAGYRLVHEHLRYQQVQDA
eukprot:2563546-Prymnesium_polylepis.2